MNLTILNPWALKSLYSYVPFSYVPVPETE